MWAVMMTGMMLPSASPLVVLYGVAVRRSAQRTAGRQITRSPQGTSSPGPLQPWRDRASASIASLLLVSPMMEPVNSRRQCDPPARRRRVSVDALKRACLRQCRSPIGFLMGRWRRGWAGAFRMGLEHGAYCVGCCWVLMLLLFAGGVMNLLVIVGLTAIVAFEKLAPLGRHGPQITGGIMRRRAVDAGALSAIRPGQC